MRKIRFETEDGLFVCAAEIADTFLTRLRGLIGRRELAEGGGLWLTPCRSVHTIGLRFPIDVIYLTEDGLVTKIERTLPPFRLSVGGRGARSALELPSGAIARLGIGIDRAIRTR